MTKKQKTILFSVCAFLFLLSATIIMFYSQGFRFDFEKKNITQTGAFYFKVLPKSTQVYLNNQLKKKADFFFGSIYIENLLPKKYNIKIKKDGYFSWEKNLEIKEKEVTEAKNIVLIKESPNFFPLVKEVEKFFFSPDEKKIILLETPHQSKLGTGQAKETGWELKLYDLKSNIKSHLIKSIDIAKGEVDLFDLIFSPDSKKILLNVGLKEDLNPVRDFKAQGNLQKKDISNWGKYYLIDLDKTPATLTSLDFLGKDVESVSFHPQNAQKLFFLKEGKLAEADLIKKEVFFSPLENIFAWRPFNSNIYYLEKNGYLFKTDFSFGPKEKINEIPFSLKEETKYEISIFSDFFFLKENEDLYLLNSETKSFEKFFENIKELKISPDFEKLIYYSDSEIWVLFLKEQYSQPHKKTGEKLFLTRFSEKIEDIFWLSSHYLIFNSGNKIKITEIDDRDRINIVDLAEFKTPKIYFNQTDKKLYILSEDNLFVSEVLFKP